MQKLLIKTENYSSLIPLECGCPEMDQSIYADVWPEAEDLRRQGKLRLRQLNTMYRWGAMHCSPYYDRRAGRIEVRLWDEGLRCLEPLLRSKGIIIAEEE